VEFKCLGGVGQICRSAVSSGNTVEDEYNKVEQALWTLAGSSAPGRPSIFHRAGLTADLVLLHRVLSPVVHNQP
jgi:hypothetical protein